MDEFTIFVKGYEVRVEFETVELFWGGTAVRRERVGSRLFVDDWLVPSHLVQNVRAKVSIWVEEERRSHEARNVAPGTWSILP